MCCGCFAVDTVSIRTVGAAAAYRPAVQPATGFYSAAVGAPTVIGNTVTDNAKVELQWLYPPEMNGYIKGFKIYRSSKPEG